MATVNKPSPPKPWERAGAGSSSTAASSTSSATNNGESPALPARPANMGDASNAVASTSNLNNSTVASTANNYANRYGATTGAYGGGYGSSYGSYSSPYSRFGAGGFGSSYGGYGSYGGGYGGYGSYGASPYGGGYGGYGPGAGMPNDMSLTRQMEAGTAATFQLIQSVVSAFGGFAQMLESTYMATHSSFFAMIGVAEQFANLRNWLGEVLSVFTMIRFVKRILGFTSKQEASAGAGGINSAEFRNFDATGQATPIKGKSAAANAVNKPKASKKPIIIFFLTVVGLPWLMNKLVKLITAKQEAEARRLGLPPGSMIPLMDHNGQPLPQHMQPPGVDLAALANNPHFANPQAGLVGQLSASASGDNEAAIDPSSLTFVRAQHTHEASDEFELSLKINDIIAVLTPKEERTEPGWWRGRLRDGRIGWFPSTHVQEIPMSAAQKKDATKSDKVPS